MATTDRLEAKITVDASQAERELAGLAKKSEDAATAQGRLAEETRRAERALAEKARVADENSRILDRMRESSKGAALGLGNLREAGNKLKEGLEKQAAAVAILSSSMSTNNKEIDQGIKIVGNLAAVYGAGGPLGVALAGASFGVARLIEHWEKLIEVQRKAQDEQYAGIDKTSARRQELERQVRDLSERLEEKISPGRASRRAADEEIAANERRIEQIKDSLKWDTLRSGPEQQRAKAEIANLERVNGLLEMSIGLRRSLAQQVSARGDAATQAAEDGASSEGPTAAGLFTAGRRGRRAIALATAGDELEAEIDAVARRGMVHLERAREHKRLEEWMTQITEEETQKRTAAIEAQSRALASGISDVASIVADGVTGSIIGTEDAMSEMLGALARKAGGAIQLQGAETFAAGLGRALATAGADPTSYATMAGGAAMIAAGAAVSSGGPAAVSALLGIGGASGGSSGASGGSGSAATVGSPRRSGGGSDRGDMGSTSITIVYGGASGPTADQGADSVVRAMDLARRRGAGRDIRRHAL